MFEKIIGIILSVLTFVGSTFLGVTPKYEAFSNIAYGAGERNVIDIYVPAEAYEKEANGCILFIHGGSWSSGSKDEMMGECVALANEGYITATMNYTLINDENRDTYRPAGLVPPACFFRSRSVDPCFCPLRCRCAPSARCLPPPSAA